MARHEPRRSQAVDRQGGFVAADRFVVEMHAGTDNFTVVGFDARVALCGRRLGSFLTIPS